jgi:hypothetical protein
MAGSDNGNSIVDSSDSGAETAGVDTTDLSVDAEQATDTDDFGSGLLEAVGLDGDDSADGSNSKPKGDDGGKGETQAEGDAQGEEILKQVQDDSQGGARNDAQGEKRPDKRQRQIEGLMAEKAKTDQELAEYRKWKAEQGKVGAPEVNEDGNVTIEQMVEHQRKLARQEAEALLGEYQTRTEQAELDAQASQAMVNTNQMFEEVRKQYAVLDEGSDGYDPQVSEDVAGDVEAAITPYLFGQKPDYLGMVEAAEAAIHKAMRLYEKGAGSAVKRHKGNLDAIRNTSALVSQEGGQAGGDKDDFREGILSVI